MNKNPNLLSTHRGARNDSGLSLLEIMMATAIFTILIGATAQTLSTFYGTVELQQDRAVAAQNCRTVLGWMRAVRDDDPDNFPDNITEAFPEGGEIPNLPPFIENNDPPRWPLAQQSVTVEYEDPDANPLRVTVRIQWSDRVGRRARLSIASALTNE